MTPVPVAQDAPQVVLVLDEDDVDDVLPHAATPRATPAATIAIFPSFI